MNNDYLRWLLREAYTRDEKARSIADWIAAVLLAVVILALTS